jgi:Fe(3+) dicitrate transport protein
MYGDATRWLDLFTGVHRGFSPVAPGQPEGTKPETAINVEAGARAHPGETHAELVGFLSAIEDITGACTFSSGCDEEEIDRQFNGGSALVGGIEALLQQRVHLPERIDLSVGLTYTWTHARFRTAFVSGFPQWGAVEVGDALPYVPEHQGGAEIVLEHARLGSVGASTSARSGMWDVAGQGAIPEDTGIPPLVVLDLAAHLRITNGVELYGTMTNVTNTAVVTSWRPYGARPMAPMQIDVGIKVGAE